MTLIDPSKNSHGLIIDPHPSKKLETFQDHHFERRDTPFELLHATCPYQLGLFENLNKQIYLEHNHTSLRDLGSHMGLLDNLDLDDYDDSADLYLLSFKSLDLIVGGMRLIFSDPTKLSQGLRSFQACLEMSHVIPLEERARTFEISKLVLCEKRLKIAQEYNDSSVGKNYPHPLVHFLKPLYEATIAHGMIFATSLLNPSLIEAFKPFGIEFTLVGAPLDHLDSTLQPVYLNLDQIFKNLRLSQPKVMEFVSNYDKHLPT
ncbi:MAG TPA: hypothetical protein VI959_04785 [Alphaproteobacteria bacterium]|nr:hypothetical protein [Alphaproteobacteria bacterium]